MLDKTIHKGMSEEKVIMAANMEMKVTLFYEPRSFLLIQKLIGVIICMIS